MTKAAIYVRLSQEDRNKSNKADESESIQNQKLMLTKYCKEQGWEIYDIYCDEDYSGSDRNRPAFNRLISDAKEKKFKTIVCKTQSRFTREMEYVEKYINFLFPLWGIRFLSIVDGGDSEEAYNKKSRQINGLINEWYLEDMSQNIKATLAAKRKAGLWVGAFAPYGYKKSSDDPHKLVIDEEAAKVVRYIYHLYNSGLGKAAICKVLNREGIPNPATYKKQHGQPFQNSHRECSHYWRDFTIDNIIGNEIYIGNLVQGKSENISYKSTKKRQIPREKWCIVKDTHEPIIDGETWEKSQRIKQGRATVSYNTTPSLFANKVRCLKCGGSMRVTYTRHEKYYSCSLKRNCTDACEGTCISLSVLERTVLQKIQELYQECIDSQLIADNITLDNSVEDTIQSLKVERKNLLAEIEKINKRLKTLYVDRVDGLITLDEYKDLSEGFHSDKESIEKKITVLNAKEQELYDDLQKQQNKLEIVEQYKNIDKLDRITVNELIDYIGIGGSRNNRIIEIHWKI